MAETEFYRRRVPPALQGIVVNGIKLSTTLSVPLRDGMTRLRARVFTDDMLALAKSKVNYRMTDADAWGLAMQIVEKFEATDHTPYPVPPKEGLSQPDRIMVEQWIQRIVDQKNGM